MPFWAILVILSHSGPFQWCFGPFWGPRGYLNGPRVVQHDIYSCNIPMGSVLRSFWAYICIYIYIYIVLVFASVPKIQITSSLMNYHSTTVHLSNHKYIFSESCWHTLSRDPNWQIHTKRQGKRHKKFQEECVNVRAFLYISCFKWRKRNQKVGLKG